MISTLLRGTSGQVRLYAVMGVIFFCVSIALVFERLAHAGEFSKHSNTIRIGGIGSMIYASLTFTPLHDLMVTISLLFFLVAVFALTRALYTRRETGLFVTGCLCLVVLVASATLYYTGNYVLVLPWAQRISFAVFAIWLVSLQYLRQTLSSNLVCGIVF